MTPLPPTHPAGRLLAIALLATYTATILTR